MEITHDGGDTLSGASIYLRGSGWVDTSSSWSAPATNSVDIDDTNADDDWDTAVGGQTEIAAGNSINAGVTDAYNVRVVYEPRRETRPRRSGGIPVPKRTDLDPSFTAFVQSHRSSRRGAVDRRTPALTGCVSGSERV
ncbi:hypothetical protein ACFQL1_03705 [Halomicroarcula sp. GCM10025709]|uniref:hypothetical protein n=1 Tax=Halomicroarcula sp. GCM10025709 TaxID=3252669 RepID=UPI0036137AF0